MGCVRMHKNDIYKSCYEPCDSAKADCNTQKQPSAKADSMQRNNNRRTILITGSQGFIGSYLCREFLDRKYNVIGIDNFSKYGNVTRPHDIHPNFSLIETDITKDTWQNDERLKEIDYIIACAAMIGGIEYFHKYAYDLLATNERILASTFDFAIDLFKRYQLKRIIVLSSSMVFENTRNYPTPENDVRKCSSPSSTYGFQKLASEYFCQGAWEQYQLPYTIIRPFNCVGVGEDKAISSKEILGGNVNIMMSHVLPDLVHKVMSGQDPLHILGEGNQIRCYTNGKDIARGLCMALESDVAINEDFNISTPVPTGVLELAEIIWKKINSNKPFSYIIDKPFEYDVQKRIPDVSKANNMLGFKAEISLDESINEIIEYIKMKYYENESDTNKE